MKLSWPAALLLILLPGFLLAQSLGELAEQEKAKRKKTGAKSYSNDDLQHPSPSPSPTPQAMPSPAAKPSPRPPSRDRFKTEPTTPAVPKPSAEGPRPVKPSEVEGGSRNESEATTAAAKDEEHWRGEREARENAVKAAEKEIKDLEQRMAELGSDLNPNAADLMDPDRGKKRDAELRDKVEQLERAKAALAQAQKRLSDLDEEARRAGVPPGWVR